jgi:hypothetical protein
MNKIKVTLHNAGMFPAFLDYDVKELKCRGMSSKVDLFTYGGLYKVLAALKPEELKLVESDWLFLRLAGIFEDNGFFITDFTSFSHEKFSEKVRQAGFDKIYIEDSENLDIRELKESLKGVEIIIMEFADDPYRQS